MATNLAKIHFLAMKGKPSFDASNNATFTKGSNATIIQEYDPVEKKYKYGMIDVGYGESAKLSNSNVPDPREYDTWLLDKYLKVHGIKTLEYVIITHYHGDHYGNLLYLLKNYASAQIKINNLILPMSEGKIERLKNKMSADETSELVKRFRQLVCAFTHYKEYFHKDAKLLIFSENPTEDIIKACSIGTGQFKFYNITDEENRYADVNSTSADDKSNGGNGYSDKFSIVASYTVQGYKVLFPGDIYELSENVLLEYEPLEDYDLIQMSHHGSEAANCQKFLDKIVPSDRGCAAIQQRADYTDKTLKRYNKYNDGEIHPNHPFVRVYGVYQDFKEEWGNVDETNRASIVVEFIDGVVNYYSRRFTATKYAQKLIRPIPENNATKEKENTTSS